MTTLYPFHHLIEASATSDTVLTPFGQWFDGDSAPPDPGSALPAIAHHYRQLMTA